MSLQVSVRATVVKNPGTEIEISQRVRNDVRQVRDEYVLYGRIAQNVIAFPL